MKIVSGGQTGVDRAALDVALKLGVECGGWCPAGRRDEVGVIPNHYPVQELPNAGPDERTLQNVKDSDATLIIYFKTIIGGTSSPWSRANNSGDQTSSSRPAQSQLKTPDEISRRSPLTTMSAF